MICGWMGVVLMMVVGLPLSSIKLWLKSIVRSAGLLFVITDTASLWTKSDLWRDGSRNFRKWTETEWPENGNFTYLNPNASRCSSSSHMERLRTCSIRSSVSCDNRVCVTFSPRKNVLYSRAETIAVKSLRKQTAKNVGWMLSNRKSVRERMNANATYFGSKWSKSRKFNIRVSCDR